jgi:hypothetical protein
VKVSWRAHGSAIDGQSRAVGLVFLIVVDECSASSMSGIAGVVESCQDVSVQPAKLDIVTVDALKDFA